MNNYPKNYGYIDTNTIWYEYPPEYNYDGRYFYEKYYMVVRTSFFYNYIKLFSHDYRNMDIHNLCIRDKVMKNKKDKLIFRHY